jgi:hypothetical protein
MLEKIENIAQGSDYQQSSGTEKKFGNKRSPSNSHSSVNDSISLSPAIFFLSSINWKLKYLHIEKDKLTIIFIFDNFEFSSILTTSEIHSLEKIDYTVKYSADPQTNANNLTINFSSTISPGIIEGSSIKLQLIDLTKFCISVIEAYRYNSGLSIDSIQIQDIYFGLEYEIKSEFSYLNKQLINFLEKYLSLKINPDKESKPAKSELKLKFIQLNKM